MYKYIHLSHFQPIKELKFSFQRRIESSSFRITHTSATKIFRKI